MASRKTWPFFLFQLDQPEVGSESEPENLYGSSWATSIHLSCICRTVGSCWSSTSLASSLVILELACTYFSSAFQQRSRSMEALFSTILTSLVRLLWWSLYHLTFLSDTKDASSSIWRTMFGHTIQKAFSTSLDSISTVDASEALLHVTHMHRMSRILHNVLLWWIGASHGCPRFWTLVQLRRFSLHLVAALSFRSYPFLDSFLKQQSCLLGFLEYTWLYCGGGSWKPLMIII